MYATTVLAETELHATSPASTITPVPALSAGKVFIVENRTIVPTNLAEMELLAPL